MRSTSAMRSVMGIRDNPEELANVLLRQDCWAEDEGGTVNRLADQRCIPAAEPRTRGPAFPLVRGGMVGLSGLEPAPSSLSGIEGSALCRPAFLQVTAERQGRRDAFLQPAPDKRTDPYRSREEGEGTSRGRQGDGPAVGAAAHRDRWCLGCQATGKAPLIQPHRVSPVVVKGSPTVWLSEGRILCDRSWGEE